MTVTKTLAAVFAAAALASSGSCLAADWETVVRNADETVYLDLDSLRIAGGRIEGQVMHSYERSRDLGENWYQHRSRVMTYQFECASEMLGFTSYEMTKGELGSGEVVFGGVAGGALFPAANDPQDARLIARACNPANVARAGRQNGAEPRFALR